MLVYAPRPSILKAPSPRLQPQPSPQRTTPPPLPEDKARCHYCLEPFTRMSPEDIQQTVCPICHHHLMIDLKDIPVHLFNRPQRWDLLANEMNYIWIWEFRRIRAIEEKKEGLRGTDPQRMRGEFASLGNAQFELLNHKHQFILEPGELEALIARFLEAFPLGGGNLSKDLLHGRRWRHQAGSLSAEGPKERALTKFQIELVKDTSWGAFGHTEEPKQAVLDLLEKRLQGI